MQLLNVSKLMGLRICVSFIENPALFIFACFLIKNLVFPKIKISFVCISIILISELSVNVINI